MKSQIITLEQVEVEDQNFVCSLCEFSSFEKRTIIKHSKSHKVLQSSQPHNLETVPVSETTDNRETVTASETTDNCETKRASVTEPD
jgi:hypothetical protein